MLQLDFFRIPSVVEFTNFNPQLSTMPRPSGGAADIGGSGSKKPRAHVAYTVFTFGAQKEVEIPFLVGIMSDLAGKATLEGRSDQEKKEAEKFLDPSLKNRQFVEFKDTNDLNAKMSVIRPVAEVSVPNLLEPEEREITRKMEFRQLSDFLPVNVARQFVPTKSLLEHREKLESLLSFLDGKDGAEQMVLDYLKQVKSLSKET